MTGRPSTPKPPPRLTSALSVAVLLALAACSTPTDPQEPPSEITSLPRDLSPAESTAVAASADFGVELLARVSRASPDSNLFLSPLSAHMALGMALNGADGETFEAMRTALAMEGLSLAEANEGYASLVGLLQGLDPRVEFRIGNSLWLQDGFPFLDDYRQRVVESFDAEAESVDFSDPATLERINGWVDEATEGNIEKLLDQLRPEEIAFLVNAVYFLGDWREQFDPAATEEAPFHLEDGTTAPVPLMQRTGEYRFGRGEGFTAAELPHGGDAFVMTVVLPDEDVGIDAFAAGLDAARWQEIVDAVEGAEREIRLALPKFELEYGRELTETLEAMGMGAAFDASQADFGRMVDLEAIAPENVYLSRVQQKAFVRVDEEGTEAAAATGVGVGVTSAPPALRLDRPFLLAIRERHSGAVLFIGKFERPPAE